MYHSILFDIDNTLMLKKPSIAEMVFDVVSQSQPSLDLALVENAYAQSELWQGAQILRENQGGVRMGDEEYIRNLFRVYSETLDIHEGIFPALRSIFMGEYPVHYETAPGALKTLEELRARGVKLGIVSNHTSSVRVALEEHGLTGFFRSIVISAEVGLYKPDPKILELACEQLDTPCEECLYVGDHPFDILCAHSAHMSAAWMPVNRFMTIPAGIDAPEHTICGLKDVLALL